MKPGDVVRIDTPEFYWLYHELPRQRPSNLKHCDRVYSEELCLVVGTAGTPYTRYVLLLTSAGKSGWIEVKLLQEA